MNGTTDAPNLGWFRWGHAIIFFGMAVMGGCYLASEGDDESFYGPLLIGGVLSLFVELVYLWWDKWRVSLAYVLMLSTYVAVTCGAAVVAFKVTAWLFPEAP